MDQRGKPRTEKKNPPRRGHGCLCCVCCIRRVVWNIRREGFKGTKWIKGTNGTGKKIPVGARSSAAVQTGPGAYPGSCTKSTGSFAGVKRPRRGADHPLPSSTEVKGRVQLYLYSPSGPSWPILG